MRLSTRARYALRMMVFIARHADGSIAVSLSDVAQNTNVSRRYLEQLAISLKNAALIRGIAGRKGGYLLTRSPSRITLGQIVEAAIGPINIVECVLRPESCIEADYCECRWVYKTINDRIIAVLGELCLDDLVASPALHKEADLAPWMSICPTLQNITAQASEEETYDGREKCRQ
ncbi:MAG: Rrf2 family transcriptional regulator [Myxococcota bacterium]|nr:Rrf2 family transcriptional regulator [Myxococcota bacterium]